MAVVVTDETLVAVVATDETLAAVVGRATSADAVAAPDAEADGFTVLVAVEGLADDDMIDDWEAGRGANGAIV